MSAMRGTSRPNPPEANPGNRCDPNPPQFGLATAPGNTRLFPGNTRDSPGNTR
jgi:hypothetical protein